MCKKTIGILLIGVVSLFCSCVDDTYDLGNKELSMDVKIAGNKLTLPLGSFSPIVLDSILDLDAIPFLKADSVARNYSLSLDSNLKTRVVQKDLEALKKVSELSAEIASINIPFEEIRLTLPSFERNDTMAFGEVKLSDVTLDPIDETVTLAMDGIELAPISIKGEEHPINFEIPEVKLNPISVENISQEASFAIREVTVEDIVSDAVENDFEIVVDEINLDNITSLTFTTNAVKMGGGDNIVLSAFLNLDDDFVLPALEASFNNIIGMEDEVIVDFEYLLPKEIKYFNRVGLKAENGTQGALLEFRVANPVLFAGLDRKISFQIKFPANYKLALCNDANKKYYTLTETNTETILTVANMPATDAISTIHCYLKGIENLDAERYYEANSDGNKLLSFKDKVTYSVNYAVNGIVKIAAGTTVAGLKDGLSYEINLDAELDVEEAYGTINPVEVEVESEELDFSFSLKDLEYIRRIGKIELDPKVSQLRFTTQSDKDFGGFDFDVNSRLQLAFPDRFVFADDNQDYQLPDGVFRVGNTNVFEISSIDVFVNGEEWVLPIREVHINEEVGADGTLNIETEATIKAVSGIKEGILTVGGVENVALKASALNLCGNHNIAFSVSSIRLAVEDATAHITPIDIDFNAENIDFNFMVEGELDYISKVNFVEFDTSKPLIITATSTKDFGKLNFAEGCFIALRFPENFMFDHEKCDLPYDEKLKAFVIDDLSQLKVGKWNIALKRMNVDQEIENGVLDVETTIRVEAVNAAGGENVVYIGCDEEISLTEAKRCLGLHEIVFTLEQSPILVTEMEVNTNDIDVEFKAIEVAQSIKLESLNCVTHIGDITLKEGSNMLKFRTGFPEGGLERFAFAENSAIDFIFPSDFKLDPVKSSIPKGAKFIDSTHVRIYEIAALNEFFEWELAVKRIDMNKAVIDEKLDEEYTISVVATDADGNQGNLTIAGVEGLKLTEIQKVGGMREMEVSVLPCVIEIADAQASVGDIDFEFEKQTFDFPVDIKDLELVDEIKYISFEEGYNKINLNISLDGTLEPFGLTDNSAVMIILPQEFKLNLEESDFGNLVFDVKQNAICINKIDDVKDCHLVLALDRIEINKKVVDNRFNWEGEIVVTAIDRAANVETDRLFIAGVNNLWLSEVRNVMCDKVVRFDVPSTQLRIKEAVIVSNTVSADIDKLIEIVIDETISEPIERVDSIGFMNPVPMVLKVTASGLEDVDASVALKANITVPPVFVISSDDDKVKITDEGLSVETSHNFKDDNTIQINLWVHGLDFTGLKDGYLTLAETENGERRLQYEGEASINGLVAIDNAQLSSSLLDSGISMGTAFEMGEVVLKNFAGIYNGSIEPVAKSFELGIEDGLAELEKNGLRLANTKPELMISLYNTIGVPVDVVLSLVGRDKDGNEIPSAVINPGKTLRIKPAQFDAQGELVADTTRWIFTSDENRQEPGYEVVVVKNLDSLLNELPHVIDFDLIPTIVTENVVHRVDLSKPLELGGSYSISVPFDLQFAQSIDLDLGEMADIMNNEANKVTLANPQLALSIHNPIAQDLSFDFSLIGKDANGKPISTASLEFAEPFVLAAGHRNSDGTITPTPTRWLFAVGDSIQKEGFETKVAPALSTLLDELPCNIDIALNAHFNTDLTTQIDYNNDLELLCEYCVLVPLQFNELRFSYADTIPEIKINIEETLSSLNLSVGNIGLALSMNLKNTLPVGLTLNLIPLDVDGNVIEGIEIGNVEIPAGDGSAIGAGEGVEATPVELVIRCVSSSALSALDKISFSLDMATGNGDNVLSGAQGLQISDVVLQIICDVETDLSK